MKLNIEQGKRGLWYVTSPDMRGLFVAASTREDALAKVEAGVMSLGLARGDDMGRVKLLALAARLVIGADHLERKPCGHDGLREDCLEAAEVIRLLCAQ